MTIEELNDAVDSGTIDEVIRVCEARQVKALSAIADAVCARRGVRLLLLAGASSAGKTTTAKRLCTQLRVNGAQAVHLSTDDYFVGDRRNPRNADGSFDYETVEAVDAERLVRLRKFDFVRHDGYDARDVTTVAPGTFVVLEGIHALNPLLTADVPDDAKYRVFIEPKTQITVFAMTRLSSANGRLVRRLVRDNQFRKMTPFDTFDLWPKVLAGEEKWIAPFRPLIHAEFDSGLDYELAVLKPYAAGLVELVRRRRPDEKMANAFAEIFAAIHATSPNAVPGDSILRETIGGSQLDY